VVARIATRYNKEANINIVIFLKVHCLNPDFRDFQDYLHTIFQPTITEVYYETIL